MVGITREQKELIEKNAISLSTVNVNGEPHSIAVAFAKVVSSDQTLITDNYMVETKDNIKRGSRVAIVVFNKDWETDCKGYEFRGTAEYFTEGKWLDKVKKIHENNEEPCKGAILVTVNKIKKLA